MPPLPSVPHDAWPWIAAVALLLLVVPWLVGFVSSRRPVRFHLEVGIPGARTLVVAVHGFTGSRRAMQAVCSLARQVHPDADVLIPEFPAAPFSNKRAYDVTAEIESEINRLYEGDGVDAERRPRYDRIVLVGYSMGALLVRKAYVWAFGPPFNADRLHPNGRRRWVDAVDRIVLLAGMNRGWTVSRKEDRRRDPTVPEAPLARRLFYRLGLLIGWLTGSGRQMLDFVRGSPFVADLRVQWITLARREADEAGRQPRTAPVIQLLGARDDVVSPHDNSDLIASTDFLFIPVPNTGHGDMATLDPSLTPGARSGPKRARADALRKALGMPVDELRRDSSVRVQRVEEDPRERDVFFVMHGIRDFGHWTTKIAEELLEGRPDRPDRVVITSSYGYFPMGRFLLLGARQKNVRWFMDLYTEARALYPRAAVSYVGHSNGTYLLASALQHYRSLRVKRALFAGSVVNQSYDWNRFTSGPQPRVEHFRNVVAAGDWVVAIFPRLFELLAELTPLGARGLLDLGAAGFNGFSQQQYNVAFVKGAHSAAIDITDRAKLGAIVSYLTANDDGTTLLAPFKQVGDKTPWVAVASKLCWLVWLALIALLALVVLGVGGVASNALVAWIACTLVILAILYTI